MDFLTGYTARFANRVTVSCAAGSSRTKQEFKEECDINTIMKKYVSRGVLPVGVGVGTYDDYSDATDYQEALNTLIKAKGQFDSLPSDVRKRFENNPAKFLEFISDSKNLDEAQSMGLLSEEGSKKVLAAREAAKVKPEVKKE